MQQHNRLDAAGLIIGQQHGAKLVQQGIGRRQRVGSSTGRAGCGALTTSGADFAADPDVITIRRNRAGRAKIEAAMASSQV
jgi:hypothetical protein